MGNHLIQSKVIIVSRAGTAKKELVLMLVLMIAAVIVLVLVYLALPILATPVIKVVPYAWKDPVK